VEEKPGLECSDSRSLIYCLGGFTPGKPSLGLHVFLGDLVLISHCMQFPTNAPLFCVGYGRSLKNEAINIVDFAILEELTGNGISKLRGKAFMRPRRLAYMALWGVSLVQLYRNCLSEYVGHFKTSPDFVIHEAMTLLDMDLGSKAKALQN